MCIRDSNTVISGFMEYNNKLIELARKEGGIDRETLKTFVILLAPFAPHIGEELWQQLGGDDSVFHAQWPECDEEAMKDDEIEAVSYTHLHRTWECQTGWPPCPAWRESGRQSWR